MVVDVRHYSLARFTPTQRGPFRPRREQRNAISHWILNGVMRYLKLCSQCRDVMKTSPCERDGLVRKCMSASEINRW